MLKKILIAIATIAIILAFIIFNYYQKIYNPNVVNNTYLYIPSNADFDIVQSILTPHLKDVKSFNWVAKRKKYFNKIHPGKYELHKGMNNNDLVNLLRSANQIPVHLSFNNQDSLEKLAGRIAQQIEADSISLLNTMKSSTFLTKSAFTEQTALGMFIPNTYQIYWNTSAEKFCNRMLKEYNIFWNKNRLEKAAALHLSEDEVIALASIVQKETALVSERAIVAGLYLNRLRHNWPLQADPTIIFALKQRDGQDIVIKRVLTKDLNVDSPYNTYLNSGLPPGLIAMPDISSIDAVLNPIEHNYFYMCASITDFRRHEFASTLTQHNRNARKYQQWLSQQGINR